jgi:RNA recognition motif
MSKLFVGNLPFSVTAADLQAWIEANGYPVECVQVMTDHKTCRSRGIAFVGLKQNDQSDAVTITPCGWLVDDNGKQALAYGILINIFEPHSDGDKYSQRLQGYGYGRDPLS